MPHKGDISALYNDQFFLHPPLFQDEWDSVPRNKLSGLEYSTSINAAACICMFRRSDTSAFLFKIWIS
jgi:hypothetical protein